MASFAENVDAMRLLALRRQAYFSKWFLNAQVIENPRLPAPMGVDRFLRVQVNPKTFEYWGVKEAATIYAHELSHVWRRHFERLCGTGHKWAEDMAKDATINGSMQQEGDRFPFPTSEDGSLYGTFPESFGLPLGWCEEQYFEKLKELEPPPQGRGRDEEGRNGQGGSSQGDEQDDDQDGENEQDGDGQDDGQDEDCPEQDGDGGQGQDDEQDSDGQERKKGRSKSGSEDEDDSEDDSQNGSGNEQNGELGSEQSTSNSNEFDPNSDDHGSGSDGVPRSWDLPPDDAEHPAMGQTQLEILAQQVAEDVIRAALAGNVPGNIVEFAKELLNAKVPWRTQIRNQIAAGIQGSKGLRHRTFSRPHRRQMAPLKSGDLLRAGHRMITPRIVVITDTSGSMSIRRMQQCAAEVGGISKAVGAFVMHMQWDTICHLVEKTSGIRRKDYGYYGRGGTDMGAAIDEAAKQRCDIIIVLTDGYTPWTKIKPKQQIIAGIVCNNVDERLAEVKTECPSWVRLVGIDMDD